MEELKNIKVALLGSGTVGTGVYKLIERQREELPHKVGAGLTVSKVLVRDKNKKREGIDPSVLTDQWEDIITDDEIQIVVEVMGGIEPARTYITEALQAGKNVVTANKDLMAVHGGELLDIASHNGCDLLFEASVAGGIPIINGINENLTANKINELYGIVNGTTNYILSKMELENLEFNDVLEEAKEKGVELIYVNTAKMDDPVDGLKALSVDGKGFDDVFVYVPARPVAELGNKILGYDGCMNLFAGPTDSEFSADVNLYDCHYNATKILGSTGGSIDDMKEAIDRAARKEIKPAVMITHVGGIDSIVDTTMNLPNIPGGKKLSYLHINMPMTAISDLRSLAKDDPFFNELADICDRHNGLWSAEAEKALLTHYGVE